MKLYRICSEKYGITSESAFSGIGARQNPGRWNNRGVSIVYTAETLSLAMLEMLVHLDRIMLRLSYVYFEVNASDDLICELTLHAMPQDWNVYPAPPTTKRTGDQWVVAMSSVILKVPNVLNPLEHTFLINPNHDGFEKLLIKGPFAIPFDGRLK
jgi:RES domain-containing protein